ncbi:MAG: hypothetical protein ABIQ10_11870 [Gemmatimonadaceae bacterium]
MRQSVGHLVRMSIAVLALFSPLACETRAESAPRVPLSQTPVGNAAAAQSGAQPAAPSDFSPRARLALDSGNAQFRSGRYHDALASYRASVKEAPGHTAPEFGVYMAARKLGNAALADSALRIVNAHTSGSQTWTHSAMQSAHGSKARPASHPPVVRE